VSVAMLKALSTRRPYVKMAGAPDNNIFAEAMLEQMIGTLVLCVLLKARKEAGGHELLPEGVLDYLMVACQFAFVFVLLWKMLLARGAAIAPRTVVGDYEVSERVVTGDTIQLTLMRARLDDVEMEREEAVREREKAVREREEAVRGREEAERVTEALLSEKAALFEELVAFKDNI